MAEFSDAEGWSFCDDASHFQDLVGIAPLVVVPGDQFHEGAVQCDAGFGVKHAGVAFADEVGGYDLLVGVGHHAFQRSF